MRGVATSRRRAIKSADAARVAAQEIWDGERTRLFRLDLQAKIVAIPPVAVDQARLGGINLDEIARGMLRLPPGWGVPRSRPLQREEVDEVVRSDWPASLGSWADDRRLPFGVVTVREADHLLGGLRFVAADGVVEVAATLGSCVLQMARGFAALQLPSALPGTIVAALPGRRLRDFVAHPALRGRYRISAVGECEFGGTHSLVFRTGLRPRAMPWADELAALVAGASRPVEDER